MSNISFIKNIQTAKIVFWLLLLYTIAALVWWFITLQLQSSSLFTYQKNAIELTQYTPLQYNKAIVKLQELRNRRTAKHISEGATFLIIIILGSILVYNAVQKQLQLNQQQQNFIMAVSHELKTPITISQLNLQTLQRHSLAPQAQQQLLTSTVAEMHRLNELVTNILVTSQVETKNFVPQKETIALQKLVQQVVTNLQAQQEQRVINYTHNSQYIIQGDSLLLSLAITNVLDNALKYSPTNTTVQVLLQHNILQVIDTGSGISKVHANNVFNKFYRIGNESIRNTKGTGLGLYLTRKILQNHNSTITLTNNEPNGCIFTLQFA